MEATRIYSFIKRYGHRRNACHAIYRGGHEKFRRIMALLRAHAGLNPFNGEPFMI